MADLGVILDHPTTSAFLGSTSLETGDVAIQIRLISLNQSFWCYLAEVGEEVFNGPRIRINRFGALALEDEALHKGAGLWLSGHQWVIFPFDFLVLHFWLLDSNCCESPWLRVSF